MSKCLERRIAVLEARLNAQQASETWPSGERLRVVIFHGGLPPGEPLWAVAGQHEWLRGIGESLDDFADRARAAALELREPLLVLGGFPSSSAQNEVALAAYDQWLLTDDGVPPEETSGCTSRRSPFGADQ